MSINIYVVSRQALDVHRTTVDLNAELLSAQVAEASLKRRTNSSMSLHTRLKTCDSPHRCRQMPQPTGYTNLGHYTRSVTWPRPYLSRVQSTVRVVLSGMRVAEVGCLGMMIANGRWGVISQACPLPRMV